MPWQVLPYERQLEIKQTQVDEALKRIGHLDGYERQEIVAAEQLWRYRNKLEAAGLRFSGISPDGLLPEIVEIPDHPWFIGVQFHPELKSRPFSPHPLFASFIGAAVEQSRLV